MTHKERAIDIVTKITNQLVEDGCRVSKPMVKKISLIAIEEIIRSGKTIDWSLVEVKKQIELL
jgi:hypothetical protein